MQATSCGTARCAMAVLFLVLLVQGSLAPVLASAEAGRFDCGRENHEYLTEPGAVWFETYGRRFTLAGDLRRNGNHDLAGRFEECALSALRRAAEFGHREAQYQYGLRILARKPQTSDTRAEAHEWLKKAAAGGHEQAKLFVKAWTK